MARFNPPVWGNISGKLGDLVICRGKIRWYVRRKAKVSHKPPTRRQCVQRKRLGSTVLFYKAAKEAGLHEAWKAAAVGQKMTGFNLFVKANIRNFSETGEIVDFANIRLSSGRLELPDLIKVCDKTTDTLSLNWEVPDYLPPERDDDRPIVALMKNKAVYSVTLPEMGSVCRKDGRVTIRLPPDAEEYHHLYVFFQTETGKAFSETRYFEI